MDNPKSATSSSDFVQAAKENYEARTAYRDTTVATQYDQRRFRSWRGRLGDWLDKRALGLALEGIPQAGGGILDIPCGTGRITSFLAGAGYEVVAADVAAEMIAVARDRFGAVSLPPKGYVQADAVRLPFRADAFMCATAVRFMGHIPSAARIQILRELNRVSRGVIVADYSVSHPITNARRRIEHSLGTRRLGLKQKWTWHVIPRHELETEFQAANLQAVRWIAKARFLSDSWIVVLAPKSGRPR